ncbi:MAG: hypothetical protein IKZ19_04695 [Clostridia bacterium]|nr:hypothetical protein [Clostridia bacterium]
MRRKTLSPAFVAVLLLAMTACILCLTFYLQALNVKSIYGTDIRVAIYEANEITENVPEMLSNNNYSEIVRTAAKLEALKDAGLLHNEIETSRNETARALFEYAEALNSGEFSESAMELLREDALNANSDLRQLVQHSITKLSDTDLKKMDRQFYKAMDAGSRFHKELTLIANND